MKPILGICLLIAGATLAGCVTPRDYTNFRAHQPRSILVLPPINESTDIRGTYSYLASITYPISEMGYYVYPVVLADQLLKENGLPTPGEMHQAPLDRLKSVFGADAVLYITLKEYGTKYYVINSVSIASADAKLVDTATGTVLWEGRLQVQQGTNNSGGGLVGAIVNSAINQAISSSTDRASQLARAANRQLMIENRGLLYGPYHTKSTAK
jgi:hypothetical protein